MGWATRSHGNNLGTKLARSYINHHPVYTSHYKVEEVCPLEARTIHTVNQPTLTECQPCAGQCSRRRVGVFV